MEERAGTLTHMSTMWAFFFFDASEMIDAYRIYLLFMIYKLPSNVERKNFYLHSCTSPFLAVSSNFPAFNHLSPGLTGRPKRRACYSHKKEKKQLIYLQSQEVSVLVQANLKQGTIPFQGTHPVSH